MRGAHPWDNLTIPFLPPLGYLRVDLVPKLWLDLALAPTSEPSLFPWITSATGRP